MSLRHGPLLLLFLWQSVARDEPPVARPQNMRYVRALSVPTGSGQACAALDAQVFTHAQPSLKDLRLFPAQEGTGRNGSAHSGIREIPYAITLSEPVTEDTQTARVLNLGTANDGKASHIVFDLEMPDRAYTEVSLELDRQDFIATATVSGMETLGGKATALGVFTLFDLTSQKLARDTTLPLPESTFRYLHVLLSVSPAPGAATSARFVPAMVEGAQVPPSRMAQTVYTNVATVTSPTKGAVVNARTTRFDFALPMRVPVERVSFDLPASYTGNFSRDVLVHASPVATSGKETPESMPLETLSGTISRVHSTQAGHRIDEQQLSLPMALASNLQGAARVWVEVKNGDDQPLPLAAVRLEMRQRKLCFDAPLGESGLSLYYGDPALAAPVYDYDRLFVASSKPLAAELGPEQINPGFTPPPTEARPFTERHPEVLWIALIAVICALGLVALRSSRNVGR
jgi:hypothetical protein